MEEFEGFFDEHLDDVTRLINFSRDSLGDVFDEEVDPVSENEVRDEFRKVTKDDDLMLNLAAFYKLGVELELRTDGDGSRLDDVADDYAGFIVDEVIGRRIASRLAGDDPDETLAEATFHYIDIHTREILDDEEDRGVGYDDVLAGLAAGLQVRLPGWDWKEEGW
ncbi:MAG: hypothetical protein SV760_09455 [Halobacteria archaeon]|nr:hypothetical protein [Halobacteria archaeon]